MALVLNEAIAYADDQDFFDANAASLKNSLAAAGYTVAGASPTYTATALGGETQVTTIHAVNPTTLDLVGNLRHVRAGWQVAQGPIKSIVKATDVSVGRLTPMSTAGFVAGAATIAPFWNLYLTVDLDATNHRVHVRVFRAAGFLGQLGNLIADTALQLPGGAFTGWVFMDKNGMLLVAKHGAGDYRALHVGMMASARTYPRSARSQLSGAHVAPTSTLTLPAGHASMDGWTVGQIIYIHDATTGNVEKHTITAIHAGPSTLDIDPATAIDFADTSVVGRDPHPAIAGGSIYGPMGPAFYFEAPDHVVLDPGVGVAAQAKTVDSLEAARLGADADGTTILSPIRYERFGANTDELVGLNLRAYELFATAGTIPDESLLTTSRESLRVFTDGPTGRRYGARRSNLESFLVDL